MKIRKANEYEKGSFIKKNNFIDGIDIMLCTHNNCFNKGENCTTVSNSENIFTSLYCNKCLDYITKRIKDNADDDFFDTLMNESQYNKINITLNTREDCCESVNNNTEGDLTYGSIVSGNTQYRSASSFRRLQRLYDQYITHATETDNNSNTCTTITENARLS